jgi:hypothetical protein
MTYSILDYILKFVTLGSVITGVSAIYTALRTNNRSVAAQIFLAYSERIFNIRKSLSPDTYLSRLKSERTLTADERRVVHEAFYLIFEFHALRRHGYIASDIWRIYEPDMERLLKSSAFHEEWSALQNEFSGHPKFIAWVSERRLLSERRNKNRD